jgi:hypothetical protein
MSQLLAMTLGWLAPSLGLLILIVALLLAGAWLKSEWEELRAIRQEIEAQDRLLANLRAEVSAIDAAIDADARGWREQMAAASWPLRTELEQLEAQVAQAQPQWQAALRQFTDLERQARDARAAAQRARAGVETLERSVYWWDRYVDPGKVLALEAARAKAQLLERTAQVLGSRARPRRTRDRRLAGARAAGAAAGTRPRPGEPARCRVATPGGAARSARSARPASSRRSSRWSARSASGSHATRGSGCSRRCARSCRSRSASSPASCWRRCWSRRCSTSCSRRWPHASRRCGSCRMKPRPKSAPRRPRACR